MQGTTFGWMTGRHADLVLFDLGGVLIELGGVGAMQELAGIDSDEEVWRPVAHQPLGAALRERPVLGRRILERGRVRVGAADLPRAVPARSSASGRSVRSRARRSCSTEVRRSRSRSAVSATPTPPTGSTRWPAGRSSTCSTTASSRSTSGLVKPDRCRLRARWPSASRSDRDRVLFLDDNAVNADAARSVGFRAEHVRGLDRGAARPGGGGTGPRPVKAPRHRRARSRGPVRSVRRSPTAEPTRRPTKRPRGGGR